MIIKRKVRLLNKSELKLIKGGLCDSPAGRSISFISAYVTDTNDNDGVAKAVEKFVLEG